MKWTLELSLRNNRGESYFMAIDLPEEVAREYVHTPRPDPFTFKFSANPMDDLVSVMRRREFRKDLFIQEARNLGHRLAERMEDKEGWHGEERAENLKEWGSKGW